MRIFKRNNIFCIGIFILSQFASNSLGAPLLEELPDLLLPWMNFGDYMEVEVLVTAACENVTDGKHIGVELLERFAFCLSKIDKTPSHYDGKLVSICGNPEKYLQCWDDLKEIILFECGAKNESLLPAVYRATLASDCGTDNGAKNIRRFWKAVEDMQPGDMELCEDTDETFENYRVHCETLLDQMKSPELCIRHAAIDACMGNVFSIICHNVVPNIFMSYIQRYTDAKPYIKCNE